jgi:hypothetical protein
MVCRFRYLKELKCRRTSGLVIDRNDTAWIGGRTPPVNYPHPGGGVRFSGAISWYDSRTETIGAIREPFLHYSLRDLALAGKDHVLGVATLYPVPYDPLPENAPRGKIVVINVDTRQPVLDIAPTGAGCFYAAETDDGKVVIFSRPSEKITDKPHGGIFMIFDAAEMRVTDMVVTPLYISWGEYSVLPFKKGPDNKIYFYGKDKDGTALFRFNAQTCAVEPVLSNREVCSSHMSTASAAWYAFAKDRVYFAGKKLYSLPLKAVLETPAEASK